MELGFQIEPLINRPDRSLIDAFQDAATAHISDNMSRLYAGGSGLRPYHATTRILGTAFTVKTRPGDNLLMHKALDMAEPGDVIVVDAGGDLTNAIAGEIMMRWAQKKGLAGFVIDGAIRDSGASCLQTFPVFARGITHRGPYKDGPGTINLPVTIGEMHVHPGDIIVGDEDGLIAIPKAEAEEMIRKLHAQQAKEEAIMRSIEEGTLDRSWVDQALTEKGCVLPRE
ncbi:RraA family protein [Marinicrinis sediminis]|uniref:Putative 4-hydroxy-4-methyl-2-oxoglutarate aldolase n=1 Tax=Marinicrinis sediminis TaxID=1652465 RepID=A0ABW5R9R8_9BACL